MMQMAALTETHESSDDWTCRRADTGQVTHGIHQYPAMMIPQNAKRLVRTCGREGASLSDPSCGSGTTLPGGFPAGATAAGTDLNALARLIARVKTTPVRTTLPDREISRVPRAAPHTGFSVPDVPNMEYWFASKVQCALAAMRRHIDTIADAEIADMFRVAFSLTVRKASWTRKTEFKLDRMEKCQMDKHDPGPFDCMVQTLPEIGQALLSLNHSGPGTAMPPIVYGFNSVSKIPPEAITPGSIDLVVTPPPCGDSRTTVAYGQFCRLSSQWPGCEGAGHVDKMLMGGGRVDEIPKSGLRKPDTAIMGIAKVHQGRARDVASFFEDYRASTVNVASAVKRGGHACNVVGNHTVKERQVPTAEATAAFFEECGFKTVGTCTRNTPNKRMPAINSPGNVPGKTGKTMTMEKIVICRKVGCACV